MNPHLYTLIVHSVALPISHTAIQLSILAHSCNMFLKFSSDLPSSPPAISNWKNSGLQCFIKACFPHLFNLPAYNLRTLLLSNVNEKRYSFLCNSFLVIEDCCDVVSPSLSHKHTHISNMPHLLTSAFPHRSYFIQGWYFFFARKLASGNKM